MRQWVSTKVMYWCKGLSVTGHISIMPSSVSHRHIKCGPSLAGVRWMCRSYTGLTSSVFVQRERHFALPGDKQEQIHWLHSGKVGTASLSMVSAVNSKSSFIRYRICAYYRISIKSTRPGKYFWRRRNKNGRIENWVSINFDPVCSWVITVRSPCKITLQFSHCHWNPSCLTVSEDLQ